MSSASLQKLFISTESDDSDDIEIKRFEVDSSCPAGLITGGYKAELTTKQKDSLKKIKLNQPTAKNGPH